MMLKDLFNEVSNEEIVQFLDTWLVNYRALKLNSKAVELVKKLTPYFPYTGEMYRGLFEPLVKVGRSGVEACIDSWSKSQDGIENMVKIREYTFGSVNMDDGSMRIHTEEEFILMNENASPNPFDRVLKETHTGLDLSKLAEHIGYRMDFLSRIKAVEEVLVIRNMN